MDSRKAASDNRTNQCNPNHQKTGPGHQAYYSGDRAQSNVDNRANQLNPNNPNYAAPKK